MSRAWEAEEAWMLYGKSGCCEMNLGDIYVLGLCLSVLSHSRLVLPNKFGIVEARSDFVELVWCCGVDLCVRE